VVDVKSTQIPEDVIVAWNEVIAEHYSEGASKFTQDVIIKRIIDKMKATGARGIDRSEVFAKHWLDVEDLYRANGWKVDYDKPGYNETYESHFTFTPVTKPVFTRTPQAVVRQPALTVASIPAKAPEPVKTHSAWKVQWIERERGFGQRPDGADYYPTKEKAQASTDKTLAEMRKREALTYKGRTPDEYTSPEEPKLVQVSAELAQEIQEKGHAYRERSGE
jgi:hypothetical protein